MQITILNVQQQTKTGSTGKPYQTLEVAYKDSFGKVASKTLMSFGAQANAYKSLANATAGSIFTLTVVKNEKGYNDWTNAVQAPPGSVAQNLMANEGLSTGKQVQVKSTYETPEERAKKQVYIIRQSSISSAVDTLTAGAKSSPKPEDVLAVAQQYYSWVMADPNEAVKQDVFSLPNDVEVE